MIWLVWAYTTWVTNWLDPDRMAVRLLLAALMLISLAHGNARDLLWLGSVCVDLLGGLVGFATPGLGRSRTSDWTIEGGHFAERCQAFILIALGESIVIIGATLSGQKVTTPGITAFVVAFAGAVALWWLYFDRSAEAATEKVAQSADPGRLGRSAYHLIHPVMVAGVIVAAAATT